MADVAKAADTTTTEAQPRVSVAEERTPSPPPAPAVEKAAKGKGLRALRDRIALRRSFSTKHPSLSSPTLLSPTSEQDEVSPVASPTRETKYNPLERLLSGRLGGKKGGKKAKDTDAAPVAVALDPVPSTSSASTEPEGTQVLPAIPETEAATPVAAEEADVAPADKEALPLARKIHSLLSSLPPFLSTVDPPKDPNGGEQNKGDDTTKGPSTTPDAPPVIPDSRLFSLLSSPKFMNGSLSRGRQSVWAMLDNLRLKSLQSNASAGIAPDEKRTEAVLEDNDSIMFYIPLVPDEASAVELARSEIVSVDENGAVVEVLMENAPPPMPPMSATDMHTEAWKWHWPWKRPTPSPPPKPKTVEKRVWVPSTEKLSLQVMWWGYRLWLPPPVLAKLNDKQIEAAKLAAMVTTALQWLLNNVPEGALPPTLRPALMLVKSLVPYLGYIGGFVAWSWEGIKSFDVGFGVTLTATWLLPIALIPGTWEEKDVPKPAPPPSEPPVPTPDPPAGDPPEPPVNPTPPPSSDPSTPPTSPPTCPPAPAPAPEPAPPTSPTTDPLPPNGPSVI